MTRPSAKAVLVGVLVDLVATGVLVVVAGIVFPAMRAALAAGAEGRFSSLLLVTSMLIGFPTLALGGFVAGSIARRAYVLHGALVGVACLVLGFIPSTYSYPFWFSVTVAVLDVPVAIWGSLLAKSRASRRQVLAGA